MKAKFILYMLTALLGLNLSMSGCGEDRWAAYATQTATDRWIDDTMRVWYYWAEEMPESKNLNYFQAPATFFKSLLNSSDKFSSIDSLFTSAASRSIGSTSYSYGMEYSVTKVNDTAYYAHVLYTVDDSPASEAGLQRGDWVMSLGGAPLTKKNYTALLGGAATEITVGRYDAEQQQVVAVDENPRTLPAARAIDDNPVYCVKAFDVEGIRVGYLAYNHFTPGTAYSATATGSATNYDDDLRLATTQLAASGISELVLDLRYNNGGYISCAQLLATLLAPASALGQPMATLEYNPKIQPVQLAFDASLIGQGTNLNLKRLFVLTTGETASASEMVMNCLKPYMEVVQIGTTTVGKNMGARSFDNAEQMVTMTPMICKIYNALGESDYDKGFSPSTSTLRLDENNYLANFFPLGNPEEALLYTALSYIAGESASEGEAASSTRSHSFTFSAKQPIKLEPIATSLTRRATQAVMLP